DRCGDAARLAPVAAGQFGLRGVSGGGLIGTKRVSLEVGGVFAAAMRSCASRRRMKISASMAVFLLQQPRRRPWNRYGTRGSAWLVRFFTPGGRSVFDKRFKPGKMHLDTVGRPCFSPLIRS